MAIITAKYDYVQGYLRYGTVRLKLEGEELEEFKSKSEEEQKEWLHEEGKIEVDYEINDFGDLDTVFIQE